MITNEELLNKLTKVNGKEYDTGITDDQGKMISIDNFGSFLNDKKDLPSNEELNQRFSSSLNNDTSKEDNKFTRKGIGEAFGVNFEYSPLDLKAAFNNNFLFLGMNCAMRKNLERSNWKMFHDIAGDKFDVNMLRLRLLINSIDAKGCYITDALKQFVDSDSGNVADDFFLRAPKLSFNQADTDELNEKRVKKLLTWDRQALINKEKSGLRNKKGAKLTDDEKAKIVVDVDNKLQSGELHLAHVNEAKALEAIADYKAVYEKSIKILLHELDVVDPKQVVIFGTSATTNLVKMIAESKLFDEYKKDDKLGHYHDGAELRKLLVNAISSVHYASQTEPAVRDIYLNHRNAIKEQLVNE